MRLYCFRHICSARYLSALSTLSSKESQCIELFKTKLNQKASNSHQNNCQISNYMYALMWATSEGISLFCLHNVGIWILISSSQILFWYKLFPTTYGPQKSEKMKVLKSELGIFLYKNWSQIEILNKFLCIPWFSFQKVSNFCKCEDSLASTTLYVQT